MVYIFYHWSSCCNPLLLCYYHSSNFFCFFLGGADTCSLLRQLWAWGGMHPWQWPFRCKAETILHSHSDSLGAILIHQFITCMPSCSMILVHSYKLPAWVILTVLSHRTCAYGVPSWSSVNTLRWIHIVVALQTVLSMLLSALHCPTLPP